MPPPAARRPSHRRHHHHHPSTPAVAAPSPRTPPVWPGTPAPANGSQPRSPRPRLFTTVTTGDGIWNLATFTWELAPAPDSRLSVIRPSSSPSSVIRLSSSVSVIRPSSSPSSHRPSSSHRPYRRHRHRPSPVHIRLSVCLSVIRLSSYARAPCALRAHTRALALPGQARQDRPYRPSVRHRTVPLSSVIATVSVR